MNSDVLAEWFRRQRVRVLKTETTYWCALGPHVYQAIPFSSTIEPSDSELRRLFLKHSAIAVRFSAPATSAKGTRSYHAVCDCAEYDIKQLPRQSRQSIIKGLSCCEVEPISFTRLAEDGWPLHLDTLNRQHRTDRMHRSMWERRCLIAGDLPGFEAWAALVGGKLAAAILLVRVDDWILLLFQDSSTELLPMHPNHALVYSLTKSIMSRPNTTGIFYALQSLDASPNIDDFKFRMGYRRKDVSQRVEMHPLLSWSVSPTLLRLVQLLRSRMPTNPIVTKGEGLLRVAVAEKTLCSHNTYELKREDPRTG